MPALSAGYDATRARISGLVVDVDPNRSVPACAGSLVRDVVARLCRTAEALVRGERLAPEQGDEQDEVPIDDLLDRWAAVAAAAGAAIDDGAHDAFVDAVVHEHDLRAALGAPGGRGLPEVRATVQLQMEHLGGRLKRAGLGGLVIDAGPVVWTSHFARAGCTVRADPWEAMRLLAGRRTADEIRALVASGDVDPYLAELDARSPLPRTSLGETH